MPTAEEFLRDYLPTIAGKTVEFETLSAEFTKQDGKSLANRTWEANVHNVRDTLQGYLLTVIEHRKVRVIADTIYLVDSQIKERPDTKKKLGQAVWNILFGEPIFPGLPHQIEIQPQADVIDKKLTEMREAGSLTIYCDAGSTSETLVAQLDEISDLTGTVIACNEQSKPVKSRLRPRLRIITTSLGVAETIYKGPHREHVEAYLVGGQIWPNYRSIAGLITQRMLPSFGEMFNSCIAIIGATGYRPADNRNCAGLLCNSMEEMFVKDWLVRNADLNIAVFDASKLSRRSLPRMFAPLRAIDLVVTDLGTEETDNEYLKPLVDAFCKSAAELDVATVAV